jgi:hypothetical protein
MDLLRRRWVCLAKQPIAALGMLGIVAALAIGAVTVVGRRGADAGPRTPIGLYQSEGPVGTGPVGRRTCAALRLDAAAYRAGRVVVWWWSVGPAGCTSSSSGIVSTEARLTTVRLAASSDLPDRTAGRIDLELRLIPDGSEVVTFTLDLLRGDPEARSIIGYRGSTASGSVVEFKPVATISVAEPGHEPAPTPRQP